MRFCLDGFQVRFRLVSTLVKCCLAGSRMRSHLVGIRVRSSLALNIGAICGNSVVKTVVVTSYYSFPFVFCSLFSLCFSYISGIETLYESLQLFIVD